MAGTKFSDIYNCFLGKITDDMYLELTPQDTMRDLHNLLMDVIPGFEFPRFNLEDYTEDTKIISPDEVTDDDFVLSVYWGDLSDPNSTENEWVQIGDNTGVSGPNPVPHAIVDNSTFGPTLTKEEINILACLMKQAWVQRQVTSIENIRMKYTGSDFKSTSQANHLAKLLSLLEESRRDQFHMQRLYGRRIKNDKGLYKSNWNVLDTY